jgi:hypothetical protein
MFILHILHIWIPYGRSSCLALHHHFRSHINAVH